METQGLTKPCAVCGEECAGTRRVKDRAGRYVHRSCYEKQQGSPTKPCAVCGWECADRPRVRDQLGRYFHNKCYEKAKRRTRAKREAAEAQTIAAPEQVEPKVEHNGHAVPEQLPPPARTPPPPPDPEPETAASPAPSGPRVADWREYVKPLLPMAAGVSAFVIMLPRGLEDFELTRAVGSVVLSLTVLTSCAVLAAVVVGLAAKTRRDGSTPMMLIVLRVAGISAALVAVALVSVVTVPGDLGGPGLIVAIIVAYGMTGWLFRLDFAQVAGLVLLAIGLSSVAGLVLALTASG